MKILSLLLLLLWVPLSCQQNKSSHVKPESPDPKLFGEDQDHDGIRDDVQIHLGDAPPDAQTQKAIRQYIQAFQQFLVVADNAEAQAAGARIVDAIQCLYFVNTVEAPGLIRGFQAYVLNNEERVLAYLAVSKMLGGRDFPHRSWEDKSQACVKE